MNQKLLNALALEMLGYESGCPERIQHFTKVHAYAKLIGELEGLDEDTRFTLETAAYVHDIGIRPALVQYGSDAGPYQEALGPALAEELLGRLGFGQEVIQRVSYLVGHHHTYTKIDGLDYQILVEADFLVNLYENQKERSAVVQARDRIFRTGTGIAICNQMFGIS